MKNIRVELVEVTSPERVLKAIAKPYRNEKPSLDLVRRICVSPETGRPHESVLEHVVFTFDVLGSSRLELQEHMRHRIASPTVESTRFALKKIVDVNAFSSVDISDEMLEELFVQPNLDDPNDPKLAKLNAGQKQWFKDCYRKTQVTSILMITDLIRNGLPNDVAKYCVCEGFRTNFTWTLNLRSLLNFLELRDSMTAHFEIREIARQAKDVVWLTWVSELLRDRYK